MTNDELRDMHQMAVGASSGGVVQPTDAQIDASINLSSLEEIMHRACVPESYRKFMRNGFQSLAVPQAPLQAEPVPVVASEADMSINGEPANAHSLLAALIDIHDDIEAAPFEHRSYIPEAWGDTLEMARRFLATSPAEPVPLVGSEQDERAAFFKWFKAEMAEHYSNPFGGPVELGEMPWKAWQARASLSDFATPQAEPAVAEQAREASSVLEAFLTHWVEDVEPKWKTLAKDMARHDINTNRLTKELESSWRAWQAALASQSTLPPAPDMPAICAALGFDPTNHHNAAKCPYCNPARASTPPPESAGQGLSDAQRKDLLMAALYLSSDEGDAVLTSTDGTRIVQTLFDAGDLDNLLAANPTAQPDGGSKA